MNADPKIDPAAAQNRPEFEIEPTDAVSIGDVERPLSFVERVVNNETRAAAGDPGWC